jgi:hypothetical protein
VYEDDCVDAFGGEGQAYAEAKLKEDPDSYLERLKMKAGEDTEMWFYQCAAQGTEAAVTFSPNNARCTVIFRGTEFSATRSGLLDMSADLKGIKKHLGPDGDDDHPGCKVHPDCLVHRGFRGQYYGEVAALTLALTQALAASPSPKPISLSLTLTWGGDNVQG